jgi:hypothetical protein
LNNFLVQLKLDTLTPLQVSPKDVSVDYDEKTEELSITCNNLKTIEAKKQSIMDRMKSFLRLESPKASTNAAKLIDHSKERDPKRKPLVAI